MAGGLDKLRSLFSSSQTTNHTRPARRERGKHGQRTAREVPARNNIKNAPWYREAKARNERINAKKTKATDFHSGSKEYFEAKAGNARLDKQKYKDSTAQKKYEEIAKGYDKQAASAPTHQKMEDERARQATRSAEPTFGEKVTKFANDVGTAFDRSVKAVEIEVKINALRVLKAGTLWKEHPWDRFKIECQLLALQAQKTLEE